MKPNERCQNGRNHKLCLCNPMRGIFNHIAADQKTVAERQWQKPTLAPKPQAPCDIGLFSDDSKQKDLF
jgi:hypothetical protein